MYSYIKGVITEVCATHITIESNGIGYLIKVPNPYQFNVGTNSTIYVYQNVREDLIELYGFQSNDEKSSFINLSPFELRRIAPSPLTDSEIRNSLPCFFVYKVVGWI